MPLVYRHLHFNPDPDRPLRSLVQEGYETFSEIQKVRNYYQTKNHRFQFTSKEEDVFVLHNIWIPRKNLKSVAFLMLAKCIDVQKLQLQDLPLSNVDTILKIDAAALSSISNLIDKNHEKNDYYKLPFLNKSYIPKAIEDYNYFAIICEPLDPSLKEEFNIVVDKVYPHEKDEIRRILQLPKEYLIRRTITFNYETTAVNNKIKLLSPQSLSYLMIHTEKDVSKLECTIKHKNKVERKYVLTTGDPNYALFASNDEDKNTFLIDPYENMFDDNVSQPKGVIHMRKGSYLEFGEGGIHKVSVTYVVYDIIRYLGGMVGFIYEQSFDRIKQDLLVDEEEEEDEEKEKDNEIQQVAAREPVFVPFREDSLELQRQWVLLSYYRGLPKRILSWVFGSALYVFKSYSKITAINSPLGAFFDICAISYKQIRAGDYYYSCKQCLRNFDHDAFMNRAICADESYSVCPNCKHNKMDTFPQMYRNSSFLGIKYGNWKYVFTGASIFGLACLRFFPNMAQSLLLESHRGFQVGMF